MTTIPFPLRSNPAGLKFLGEPRLVNCYAEDIGQEARSPVGFLSIPGQVSFSTPTDVPSRGMIEVPELSAVYSIHGSVAYKINSAGTATALSGTVAGSNPVIMERGPERFPSSSVEITIASPAIVTWQNHRMSAGDTIQFTTTGDLPTGLEVGTTYYVIASGLTGNAFQVSATSGGSAINTSGDQTGSHTATRAEATYQVVVVSDEVTVCIEDDQVIFVTLPEPANSVTFLDGRWVYGTDGGKFYWSALNDATTVSGVSYATAEGRPDGLVRALADRGELWLLGKKTIEVWTGTGDIDLPFESLAGTFIDRGCASKMSVVSHDNAVNWVGEDGIVYRGDGYSARRISTHAVERAIGDLSDKSVIRAYEDSADGHSFLVLTCTEWTWVRDASTGFWHERKSYERDDWRAWPYVFAFGKRLVGDKASGAIRELSETTFDEAGDPIRCELILPDVPGRAIFDRLEIDLATGVGLNVAPTADYYDPKVMLSWSDDGGRTWANERTHSVGREGQWDTEVRFHRLGMARTGRGRRFRIAVSDHVQKGFALVDIVRRAVN